MEKKYSIYVFGKMDNVKKPKTLSIWIRKHVLNKLLQIINGLMINVKHALHLNLKY